MKKSTEKSKVNTNSKKTVSKKTVRNITKPSNEKTNEKKNDKNVSYLKIVSVVLVFCLLIVMVVSDGAFSFKGIGRFISTGSFLKQSGDVYSVEYLGEDILSSNILPVGDEIIYLSDTSFVKVDKNGKNIIEEQHGFNNPVVNSNQNNTIIYDRNGKKYRVKIGDTITFENKTSDTIICATVNPKNLFAIATTISGYSSNLVVYDKDETKLFSWKSPDYYVVDVALSDDSSTIVALGVKAENGIVNSAIFVFDINTPEIKKQYDVKDEFLFDVEFQDKNNITVVGERSVIYTTTNANSSIGDKYTVNSENVKGYSIGENGYVGLIIDQNNSGSSSQVLLLKNGEKVLDTTLNGYPINISIDNNSIVALTSVEASILNYKGELLTTVQTDIGTKTSFKINNNIYFLSESSITKQEIIYN